MFRRRSTESAGETPEAGEARLEDEAATARRKGRPTPTRKEAEAARKERLKPTRDRKEMVRRERQRRATQRQKAREALVSGDEKHLPPRDQGPARAFTRHLVDARLNVAEFLLPLLLVILLLSFVRSLINLQITIWMATIVGTTLDTLWLGFRLRRELSARFTKQERRGAILYGLLRSSQLRRLRLPKPKVKRGAPLPPRHP